MAVFFLVSVKRRAQCQMKSNNLLGPVASYVAAHHHLFRIGLVRQAVQVEREIPVEWAASKTRMGFSSVLEAKGEP